MAGPYIGRKVTSALGKSVGLGRFKGQCAALVQWFGGAPKTQYWQRGMQVKGNDIAPYTCIATFDEEGRYPSLPSGNHAAIYISQDAGGINVYDQWTGRPIATRYIRFGKDDVSDPSNNGNCFYVIL